ncbi:hypothetical protein HG530_006649 [Fusarium avenaceum]|nr:hypothetical protein HG530_006649 [Fusarium avenaceum]
MDPVTAVGLASAIISFVPLGINLLKNAREIRDSVDDSLERNQTRKAVTEEMQAVSQRLRPTDQTRIAPEQKGLHDLALKCHELSQQILKLLDKIKPKPQSSFGTYRSAFRAWSKESEIKDLEKRLDDCRSQLALGLVDLSNQNTTAYCEKLLSIAQNDASRLEELHGHIETLKKGVEVGQIGTEVCDQVRRLLGLQEDALAAIYQQRILRSMRFDGMHERDDRVHLPHESTFEWLLEDNEPADQEKSQPALNTAEKEEVIAAKLKLRTTFLSWLSSSEGIFHISGKLGSGKSTLMKLLYTHPQTRTQLQKWAGSDYLLISRFFFWKPGPELQKSLDGLCRSLLHDILEARPELIQHVLPEIWNRAARSPWQMQSKLNISADAFKSGLERLISIGSSGSLPGGDLRFCFFIDGLDECEESHSKDHIYLVRLLNDWVKLSQGRLKMVISSRDHNVFLNGFSADQRLQLHQLTWFDMRHYVRDSLEHIQNEDLKRYFLEAIPDKANGIFLWIVLVVNEIRKKVEDDASQEQLLQLLDNLPPGIEALFQRILSGLDTNSRRMAYQTMAILRTAQENHLPLSLLAFSYLEEYQEDHDFSTRERFMVLGHKVLDTDRPPSRSVKQLRGICGGLVEARGITDPVAQQSWELGFTHRSIPEMLDTSGTKRDMESSLAHFDAVNALSHLIFAEVQFINDKKAARRLCGGITWMRLTERVDTPPYHFLQTMTSWVGDAFGVDADPSQILVFHGTSTYLTGGLHSLVRYGALVTRHNFSTICQAAMLGHIEYVRWAFENDIKAVDEPWKRALVASVLLDNHVDGSTPIDNVGFFFEIVFLSDEVACFEARKSPQLFPQLVSVSESPDEAVEQASVNSNGPISTNSNYATCYDLTIWQRYLVSCFLGWAGSKYPFHPDRFGVAAEQFMKHGAPTGFHVTIDNSESTKYILLHFGGTARPLTVELGDNFGAPLEQFVCTGMSGMSFREWIEVVNPKNKARLFNLLDTTEREDCESEVGDSGMKVQKSSHTSANLSSSHPTDTNMSIAPPFSQGRNPSMFFYTLLPVEAKLRLSRSQ